jgi:hypothetical protein
MENKITKEEHLESWQKSGLSAIEYCRQKKVSYNTFQNWKNKAKNPSRWKSVSIKEEPEIPVIRKVLELSISSDWEILFRWRPF